MTTVRPRVLHVTHAYAPSRGGVQALVQALSESLQAQKHFDVSVLTSMESDRRVPRRETLNGVSVTRMRRLDRLSRATSALYHLPGMWRTMTRHCPRLHMQLTRDPFVPLMTRAIARRRADIVLTTPMPTATCLHGLWARRQAPFRWVVVPACPVDWWETDRAGMSSGVEWTAVTTADLVFALTEPEAAYFRARGIPADRVRVIGVGTDEASAADRFRTLPNRLADRNVPTIAFLARLTPGKGLDLLLRAMPSVWMKYPTARLLVAGAQTPLTANLLADHRSLIDAGGPRIQVIGECDRLTKSQLLDACDVFVLPSEIEAFGIVYIEAWAHRKPVIALRTTATEGLITHGHNGLLVRRADPGMLARSIIELLGDRGLRASMGSAGRRQLETRYTWDIVSASVTAAYNALLRGQDHLAAETRVAPHRARRASRW